MSEQLLDSVKSKYGAVAESTLSNDHAGVKAVAEAFGYSAEELTSIPAGANMGLSCGNPTATAHLRAGEVVVDLGSGGGLDVFLASKMVGPEGRAIGIDMTTAMIERSRENAQQGGYLEGEALLKGSYFHSCSYARLQISFFKHAGMDRIAGSLLVRLGTVWAQKKRIRRCVGLVKY